VILLLLLALGLLAGSTAIACCLTFFIQRSRAQRREVERVRTMFSNYVSPAIVDEVLRRKDQRLFNGRSMRATILVCRIRDFTNFAEALTPEETLRYLNEFFALTGTSVQRHSGMIDKFLSDGIIGVFGVPLEDMQQEEHALHAALDIVRLVDAMGKRWRAQGRRSIQVGIGINSGQVIAGDAGFKERREFTVVGAETLIAARLQEETEALNAFIIASAATCDVVRERFSLVPIKGHPLPRIRRLADAFIVCDFIRTPGSPNVDDLKLPPPTEFVTTAVAEAAEPPEAALRIPAPAMVQGRTSPPPPEITPFPRIELVDPSAPLRPRRRVAQPVDDGPAVPFSRFAGRDADEPMFPELPLPSVYEDGEGPPIQLPP